MKKLLNSKKKILIAGGIVLLIIIFLIGFIIFGNNGYRTISVTDIVGDVIAENNGNSYAAYKNMTISGGYALKTSEESHTFMLLDDDKYVKLEEKSHAVFEELGNKKARNTVIRVEEGTLTTEIVRPLRTGEDYIVNTPNAILSVRGTYFKVRVTMDENGDYYTDIYTYGGTVACKRVMPDGTIVNEEVLIPSGYKACAKMDEIITVYIEELIEEEEDSIDPIELREIEDDDLVGVYNASINGHEMFADSKTLWDEIEDRDIDVSDYRSPYDNKPVEEFDPERHDNGNHYGHENGNHYGYDKDKDKNKTDKNNSTDKNNDEPEITAVESENEVTSVASESQDNTASVLTEAETDSGIEGETHTSGTDNPTNSNTSGKPYVTGTGSVYNPITTTVPVSDADEAITVSTRETDETPIEEEADESDGEISDEEADDTEEDDETDDVTDGEAEDETDSDETETTKEPEETTTTSAVNIPVITSPSWIDTGTATTTVSSAVTSEATTEHICEFINYVSDGNAACTADGTKTSVCECGKTDTITDIGSATGHTEKTETIAPTCTEAGKTVLSCSVCSEVISEEEFAPLGHTEKTETTDPTCTEAGKTVLSCSVCNEVISEEEIPELGHTEVEETVEATFAAEGSYRKYCSVCDEELESEVLERLPALYINDGSITITATGYTQGDAAEETAFTGDYVISWREEYITERSVTIKSGTHNIIFDTMWMYESNSRRCLNISKDATVVLKGNGNIGDLSDGVINDGTLIFSDGNFFVSDIINNGSVIFENAEIKINMINMMEIENFVNNGEVVINNGAITANGYVTNNSSVTVLGGSFKANINNTYGTITNGTDELECIVFDTFPTEAQRTFINSDGTSYVYALTEEDKADDGKYYVWKPVGMIAINEVNFPDEVFRNYVSTNFDTDSNDYLTNTEIEAVTEIDVGGTYSVDGGVTSLKGIEYFEKLEKLDCMFNSGLTHIDISNNTELINLECSVTRITELDISKNIALKELSCCDSDIVSLDLSNNIALTVLSLEGAKIKSLDLSNNIALTQLWLDSSKLTNIDISKNTELKYLHCMYTEISSLDVSNNTKLTELTCSFTGITSLDVSNNPELAGLFCDYTGITSLDVSNNTFLDRLFCDDSALSHVDLTNNSNLTTFDGSNNKYVIPTNATTFDTSTIEGFDPTKVSNVTNADFDVATGVFTNITGDVTYTYDCGQGYSETFTLTRTGEAVDIAIDSVNFPDEVFRTYVSDNFDTDGSGYLSDSEVAAVTEIDASSEDIYSLQGVEYFTALTYLHCDNTGITSLDVSKNIVLTNLECDNTVITSLDVSNNTALIVLGCDYTGITSLDVSNNTALKTLYCSNTGITSLDVSNNTALTTLYCYNTGITSLDVSKNTALINLMCYNTKITSLDVSNNTALKDLRCYSTALAYIDLTNNSNLTTFYGSNNKYVIPSNATTFDTSTITGFDPTKVSNVTNADFDAATGFFTNITGDITYTYDCGQGYSVTFTLTRTG